MPTDPVIVVDGLTRRFGPVVAVDHLSLEVYTGEVFGLLGHNGAGKTTSVRLLNGVLAADSGYARVLDLEPTSEGPALRRRTGVLTETPSLDERLTGRETLEIYAEIYGVPRAQVSARIDRQLETLDIARRAGEKVAGYSKGMKQRLALARALVHQPDVLFLDEPTSGLDPVGARRVQDMIINLSQEERRTVLLCTHNLAEAQKICTRVAVLEQGRLVALGTPSELARRLGRGQRLELEVAPGTVATALDVIRRHCDIAEIGQDGGLISLVGVDRDTVPVLVAALVSADVPVYRVAPQEFSLEDVYFALHGGEEVGR
jgi:ABC-2 type transport system ATP-binding protein